MKPHHFLIFLCLLGGWSAGAEQPADPLPDHAVPAVEEAPVEDIGVGITESIAGAGERLPAARTTRHALDLGDERLAFTATAGAITLSTDRGGPEADIVFVAYTREGGDPAERPVTFVVNGGPGAASAYLHLGAVGPWLLPMEGATISPSQDIALVPNRETWLRFTDLVFVDPAGTGFSRLVEPDDRLRNRYLSIDGDIEALARFVMRWLTENGRLASPKFFLGESYGGFRGPLLAEALQTEHGIGLDGAILLSPVLDFGWWQQPDHNPLPVMVLLPSLAAVAMEREDAYDRTALRAAETYAAGEFVTDFLRGYDDAEAHERIVARVADLTGLPLDRVEDHAGRFDAEGFARALHEAEGRLASVYDGAITSPAPRPARPYGRAADPVLDAMTAPLTSAMLAHYRDTLDWLPERRYSLLDRGVNRAWNWGEGLSQPEALSALARVLALDERFRVLVVHGTSDLVTPYFASELLLRQLPDFGGRVTRDAFRGGHMFYTRSDSRRDFAVAARRLIGASAE